MAHAFCYAHVPLSTVTKQHGCQSLGCVRQSSGFGIGAAIRKLDLFINCSLAKFLYEKLILNRIVFNYCSYPREEKYYWP